MVLLFSIFKPVIMCHLEELILVTWIHLFPLETNGQKSASVLQNLKLLEGIFLNGVEN